MSVQIVFIDFRVPGIQELLEGLKPGEQAFVIDVLAGLPASMPYLSIPTTTSICSDGGGGSLPADCRLRKCHEVRRAGHSIDVPHAQ